MGECGSDWLALIFFYLALLSLKLLYFVSYTEKFHDLQYKLKHSHCVSSLKHNCSSVPTNVQKLTN